MPGVTGRYHRCGLCVGCRPRNSRACTARNPRAHGDVAPPPPLLRLAARRGAPPSGVEPCRRVRRMSDTPWLGDTCSLVEAFRSGERSPVEELEATLAAIERSQLNCFTF